jgi:hypothetical protein
MATSTAASPDARVIQNAHGLEVVPRDVFKHAEDTFTLANRSRVTVHVSFPGLPTDPASRDIPPGERGEFRIGDALPGVYDYWVEVALTDDRSNAKFTLRASGGSDPRIIIDD